MQRSLVSIAVPAVVCFVSSFARAQCTVDWISGGGIPGTNHLVYSLFSDSTALQEPVLYAGGMFSIAGGSYSRCIAMFKNGRWMPHDQGLPLSFTSIRAITKHGDHLIAGGAAGSGSQVVKWNGTAWTPIGFGLSGQVYALAIYNGELIAGGSFSNRGRVARFTGSEWVALGGGVNGDVLTLLVHNEQLFAGGYFTTAGAASATRIARWDGNAWAPLTPGGPNDRVDALATYGGELIVGGYFTSIGALPVNYIARWDGNDWYVLGQGLSEGGISGRVESLAVYQGDLYASGTFNKADGKRIRNIGRWNGQEWHGLGPSNLGAAEAMTVHDGELVFSGGTATWSLAHAVNVVRYEGGFSGLGPSSLGGLVRAFHLHNGQLHTAGSFRFVDQQKVNGVARWDDESQTWMSLDVPEPFWSPMIGSFGDKLAAAGTISSQGNSGVLRVLIREGENWSNLGTITGNSSPVVTGLITYEGDLVCGGRFQEVDGISIPNAARFNGKSWSSMNKGLTSSINAMCMYQGELIAAGSRVWRWDGTAWVLLGDAPSGSIRSMTVHNNELFVGGSFTDPNPEAKSHVAKWNGAGWTYLGSNSFPAVAGIGFHRERLYIGTDGLDTTIKPRVYRLDGTQWTLLAENFEASFHAFESYGRHLFLGGWFTGFNDASLSTRIVSPNWIRYGPTCRSADLNCDGFVDGLDIARLARGLILNNFSACEALVGDFTGDDAITDQDIAGFVDCVLSSGCP